MHLPLKQLLVIAFMTFYCTNLFAQFNSITVGKFPSQIKIVQVDYRETSTLVFIELVCGKGITYCNIGDQTYVRIKGDARKYHMINSINMPINNEAENRYMLFDYLGQLHCFALEFEKIPENTDFDIIEDANNPSAFNFYDVHIAKESKSTYMNINEFIAATPVKEMGRYLKDGILINYVKANNIIITTQAQALKQYGKYYTISMNIQNFSGKSILFSLSNVIANGLKIKNDQIEDSFPMQILTAYEYDKKVANKQAWNNFFVGFGEGMAAYNAGKSSSTTTYSGNSYTTGTASAYGYIGNTYGYANAYGSAYTTSYGKSHTESYNGAAAYAAQQKANENYNAYAKRQYQIRQQLNDGYVKNNTIQSQVEYSGFFYIKYKKLDNLQLVFKIDGVTYPFMF